MVMCPVLAFVLISLQNKITYEQWNNYNRFSIMQLKP